MQTVGGWVSALSLHLRVLAILAVVISGLAGGADLTSAQSSETVPMSIWASGCEGNYRCIGATATVTLDDGTYIGSCTITGEPDAPIIQHCQVAVPLWSTVVVTLDPASLPPGSIPINNPIYFETTDGRTGASHWGVRFDIEAGQTSGGTSNVRINTMQAQHGAYYDACYVLVDFSNEGCDENRDGSVTFMDVPAGTYTVHQTRNLGMTAHVPDFQITVTGQSADGWESIETWVTHSSAETRSNHVAIQTTEDSQPATDVCYVIIGFSNEGCDENGDGQVTFMDVPFGTYTVRQTADLGPNRAVENFTIEVSDEGLKNGWVTFPANIVDPRQNAPIDISLITRDPDDGHLLTDVCYVLADFSNEGCDENGDGQVTFAQIPPGTYTVRQTKTPAGYPAVYDFEIRVLPVGNLPQGEIWQIPLGFVVKQAPEQNAPNTLNVSVILIDYATGEKLDTGICAELAGISNVGCDDDLVDGQIDFLDVPAGGPYELRFTNVPEGLHEGVGIDGPYQVWIMPDSYPSSIVFAFALFGDNEAVSSNTSTDVATLNVTLRGCPEGVDPNTTDPVTACTIPLDAPNQAAITYPDEMTHEMFIPMSEQPRLTDGTYQVTVPANTELQVAYFEPSVRDAFVAVGQDSMSFYGNPIITLGPGETGQVFLYYYYLPGSGSAQTSTTSSATLLMTMRGCPEGFNPNTDDFFANCTIPLDAPDTSFLYHGGDGQGGMNIVWMERQYSGAYVFNAGPYTMNVTISGLAPVVRDGYTVFGADSQNGENFTINLMDGETREVWVFYYFWP